MSAVLLTGRTSKASSATFSIARVTRPPTSPSTEDIGRDAASFRWPRPSGGATSFRDTRRTIARRAVRAGRLRTTPLPHSRRRPLVRFAARTNICRISHAEPKAIRLNASQWPRPRPGKASKPIAVSPAKIPACSNLSQIFVSGNFGPAAGGGWQRRPNRPRRRRVRVGARSGGGHQLLPSAPETTCRSAGRTISVQSEL